MTCGVLDLWCKASNAIAPFWGWIQVGFWVVVGLLLIWALAKLKEIGGWPAVLAALASLAYGLGWVRGKRDKPLVPRIDNPTDIEGPDAEPPIRPRVQRAPGKPLFPNAPWNRK